YMPQFSNELATEPGWYDFTQARPQDPLCGPSRWSQFTGLTSAHHRMTCNLVTVACNTTGEPSYRSDINKTYLESLHQAGYWNAFIGKLINWSPCNKWETAKGISHVPAGIDDWHVAYRDSTLFNGNYSLIESDTGTNAVKVKYAKVAGDSDYGTYVLRDKEI